MKLLAFILVHFYLLSFLAQEEKVKFHFSNEKEYSSTLEKKVTFDNVISQSEIIVKDYSGQGYLGFSLDSVVKNDSLHIAHCYFYVGSKFSSNRLTFGSDIEVVMNQKSNVVLWKKKLAKDFTQIDDLIEEVLVYYENNGYPFASISYDNLGFEDGDLVAKMICDKGPIIKLGDLVIKGNASVDVEYILTTLDLNIGELFDQSKIDRIPLKLKEIVYIKEVRGLEFEFVNNTYNLYLYLDKKNANSFNAIVGVLPSENGRINITGDVKVKLINALKKGETFDFNWRKLLPLTQNLNVKFKYPYILKSQFGVESSFDLYKKDTSYLDLITQIGVQYSFNARTEIQVFYKNNTANLLSTEKYEFVNSLPEFADVRSNFYGIGLKFNNLDYKFNPTKGWDIALESSVGEKKILKNPSLNETLYSNLDLKSLQLKLKGFVDRFIQVGKRSTVLMSVDYGWLINDNIFVNELFRLGGLRTIRGFDEESIFASGYALGTLEYRFILEQNSNLFVFGQTMYYDKLLQDSYDHDIPYSFGAGINFQTKPGVFSISYSMGSQLGNPILVKTAKIHFGFVNFF